MAGKSIRVHPEAEQEYLASLAWYGERSVIAARDFESVVTTAIETIRAAPQRWPNYFGAFRRYMLHQFPFSIVYQELLSEIFVGRSGPRASEAGLLEEAGRRVSRASEQMADNQSWLINPLS